MFSQARYRMSVSMKLFPTQPVFILFPSKPVPSTTKIQTDERVAPAVGRITKLLYILVSKLELAEIEYET